MATFVPNKTDHYLYRVMSAIKLKEATVLQIITLNLPGASPAVAGLPMEGWENKAWEKADILDWDTLLSLEVDPPLGINSLAEGFGVCLKTNVN